VEGSVQRSGNRVRITAQLVRAATDKHLWAQAYERDLQDILALQDEIASGIAHEIETRLGGPKPFPPAKTVNVRLDAYEAYLKANYYFDKFELQRASTITTRPSSSTPPMRPHTPTWPRRTLS